MFVIIQELKTVQDQLQGKINGLQAAKVSLVEKLRSARRKARVNESAMRRWKALAECYERAASLEADVHEEVGMAAVQSTISEPTAINSKVRRFSLRGRPVRFTSTPTGQRQGFGMRCC